MAIRDGPFLLDPREHLLGVLPGFLIYVLFGEARTQPPVRRGRVSSWSHDQDEIARALARGAISGRDWATEVERLAGPVDLAELAAEMGRAPITTAGQGSHNDPGKRDVRFLDSDGTRGDWAMAPPCSNSVPATSSLRMAIATWSHLVVAGAFRVRNFDRLRDEGEAMVIRPTRDRVARVGEASTTCSERDNIHWFVPQGGPATTFDIVISGRDPGRPDFDIKAVDPVAGRRHADGTILAPIIGFEEAPRRFTADV